MAAPTNVVWSVWASDRNKRVTIRRIEWYQKSGRQKSYEQRTYDLDVARELLWDKCPVLEVSNV